MNVDMRDLAPIFHSYPDNTPEVFAGAHTFREVDEIWKRERAGKEYIDALYLDWSAINRCGAIRQAGAAGIPTVLDGNQFADAQCDAELAVMWALATEEVHGDGEWSKAQSNSYVSRMYAQYQARRQELLTAGAVTGAAPIR